jgi:hypothetical protein
VQPLSSAISGQLDQVQQRLNSTGLEPGTTGSSKSVTVSEDTARDWLLRQGNPGEVDAALCRSLISTLGVTALLRTEGRYPQNAPAYRVVVGCDFAMEDPNVIPAARLKIESTMVPPTTEQAAGWLVMLQSVTAHRQDSEPTSAVAYAMYAAELRRWPADIAKSVCFKFARGRPGHTGPNWCPTLAEIAQECERLTAPRQAMLAGLYNHKAKPPLPLTARGRPEPSEDEKAEVRQMAAIAAEKLKATVEAKRFKGPTIEMPSISGKPDERGLTPAMRELISRRNAG